MMSYKNIIEELKAGKVEFTYTKSDGTTRHALGTLNSGFIPESKMPKQSTDVEIKESETCRYFDIDADGWRSFKLSTAQVS